MRYVCIAKCVFRGEVVRPGAEWDGDPKALKPGDLDMLRGSFQACASEKKPEPAAKLENGLTRAQAIGKLEASGVPVPEGLDDAGLSAFYAGVFSKKPDARKEDGIGKKEEVTGNKVEPVAPSGLPPPAGEPPAGVPPPGAETLPPVDPVPPPAGEPPVAKNKKSPKKAKG